VMNDSQAAFKVRDQLARFSEITSPRFSKPRMKFLGDMLNGLQASKDVKLRCIGRGLNEAILLRKTEERLSRHRDREGMGEGISRAIAVEGAKYVGKDTLLVIVTFPPLLEHLEGESRAIGITNHPRDSRQGIPIPTPP